MITPAYAPAATERVLPRMALDFTTGVLDPRVTVSRALNTATRINSSGFVETVNADLPRFDYDPTTLAPKGLLIEEARTNLLLRSQEFENVEWAAGISTSVAANTAVSPSGTQNADTATIDASTPLIRQTGTVTNGVAYTLSVWVKASSSSGAANVRLTVNNTASWTGAASVKVALSNTWQRVTLPWTANGTGFYFIIGALDATGATDVTCYGNVDLYGAQLEAGAFATSYIPTTTTSLTRNADVVSMTGTNFSDWYNASEGAFGVQVLCDNDIDNAYYVSVNDGTSSELMGLRRFKPRITTALIIDSGATVLDLGPTGTFTLGVPFKATLAYKLNNCATAVLGNTPSTDASVTLPTVDRINIGARNGGLNPLNGWIQKLQYWPQRIINAETQAFSK